MASDDERAPASTSAQVGIDRFSFFAGIVDLRGWVFDRERPIVGITFTVSGQPAFEITELGLPSPEAPAPNVGFAAHVLISFDASTFKEPGLELRYADGGRAVIRDFGVQELLAEPGHVLFPEFLRRLRERPAGALLEVGSRARSGISRRAAAPPGWRYTGLDIEPGENVDVVGDAHVMSRILPLDHFDAAMSLAVFEHLVMPWKVVLELNRVMRKGGIAFVQTHQTFPLHDEPWDFWRVSSHAWPALFNPRTGFRVLESGMAEPTMFVAQRWHPGVNHGQSTGYAVSSVIVEKTGDTELRWEVDLAEVTGTSYPA